jgi:hypothetical protein
MSLSEQREREGETSGSNEKDSSVKPRVGKATHKNSVIVLSTGWWESARARHGEECIGGVCWMRVQAVWNKDEVRFGKKAANRLQKGGGERENGFSREGVTGQNS